MRKYIRNVNVKNAVNTILFCLLALLVAFIPFSVLSSKNFVLYFETLPFIGDGSFSAKMNIYNEYLFDLLYELDIEILTIVLEMYETFFYYLPIIFLGIIAIDLVLTLLLLLIKRNWLRIIFRIISVMLGIVMILVTLSFILCFTNIFIYISEGSLFFTAVGLYAVLFSVGFSAVLTIKQFAWFRRLY